MKRTFWMLPVGLMPLLFEPALAQSAVGGPPRQPPQLGGPRPQANQVVAQQKGTIVTSSRTPTRPGPSKK